MASSSLEQLQILSECFLKKAVLPGTVTSAPLSLILVFFIIYLKSPL